MRVEAEMRIVFDMPDPMVVGGDAISRPMDAARDELQAIIGGMIQREFDNLTNQIVTVEPKSIKVEP